MGRKNRLSKPVYWRGRQWAVTGYGIETIGEPYHYCIPKARLGHKRGNKWEWLEQVCPKTWCDVADFHEAFQQAQHYHKTHFERAARYYREAEARRDKGEAILNGKYAA